MNNLRRSSSYRSPVCGSCYLGWNRARLRRASWVSSGRPSVAIHFAVARPELTERRGGLDGQSTSVQASLKLDEQILDRLRRPQFFHRVRDSVVVTQPEQWRELVLVQFADTLADVLV